MAIRGLNEFANRPVFASFLIDASYSMAPFRDDVIAGHRLMLDILRESEFCSRGVLFIQQALFTVSRTLLNGAVQLDQEGNDDVVVLDRANYAPAHATALFDCQAEQLEELIVVMEEARASGHFPTARLAVITDGDDNHSSPDGQRHVFELVNKLKQKEWLASSIVIGLENDSFDADMLEELRKKLNFSKGESLKQNPRSIRRAFQLASQQH